MISRRDLLLSSGATFALATSPAGLALAQGAPQKGGVLRMILNVEPPSLLSAINSSLWIASISTKCYEGLLGYTHDMKPIPGLAESWDFSADGLTMRFNLRKNATWHDGKPLTSEDVKFSAEEAWKKYHPRGKSVFAPLAVVETPDPHTAIFKLRHPSPTIQSFLNSYEGQIIPKHIFGGSDILKNDKINAPVGTGPFIFKEWKKGQYIELVRNEKYWDAGKPYLDGIIARMVPDPASRVAAFEAGEVMYAPWSPAPSSDVARIRQNKNLVVETKGYEFFGAVQSMEINTRHKALGDPRVRRAIRHAIDSKFIAENIWFGLAEPPAGLLPAASTFRAAGLEAIEPSVAKANALLDEAGLKRPASNQPRLEIRILHGQTGENPRTAEYIRQALARVGIAAKLESADLGTFIRRIYTDNDFDLTVNTLFLFTDPMVGLQRFANPAQAVKGVAFGNAGGYKSDELTAKWEAGSKEPDVAKRKALFDDCQRILWRDLPIIYLVEPKFVTLASTRFKNHTKRADAAYDTFADVWIEKA